MSKTKDVGFNYFYVCTNLENGDECYLDISALLEQIRLDYLTNEQEEEGEEPQKIIYNYQGEPARLAGIQVDNNGFYHLWFERLLNYQLPIKTTLHGESNVIDIQENEFVGHEVSVLYDPDKSVMMIQRNRDSLGPTAIEGLLNSLVVQTGTANNLFLRIILDDGARIRGLSKNIFRKIQFKVSGLEANNIVSHLLGNTQTGVETVEVILSTARARDASIDGQMSNDLLTRLIDNDDVHKLQISGKDSSDGFVEKIDLLNQKLQSFITFNYEHNRHFNPISIYLRMLEIYNVQENCIRNRI